MTLRAYTSSRLPACVLWLYALAPFDAPPIDQLDVILEGFSKSVRGWVQKEFSRVSFFAANNVRYPCSQKYDRGYQHYQNLINGLSDKETIDTLTSALNRDKAQEDMICLGMLTIILTEPHNAEKVHTICSFFLLVDYPFHDGSLKLRVANRFRNRIRSTPFFFSSFLNRSTYVFYIFFLIFFSSCK